MPALTTLRFAAVMKMPNELNLEAEIESFVDGVSQKLEELLDLDLFCLCGMALTLQSLKDRRCNACSTTFNIVIGGQNT